MNASGNLTPDEARRLFLKGDLQPEDLAGDPMLLAGFMVLMREHIDHLQHQVASLSRQAFGSKSERFVDPRQRLLFESQLDELIGKALDLNREARDKAKDERKKKPPAKGHGRQPLPADLPRVEEREELPEEERICPTCQNPMPQIGWETTEKLCRITVSFVRKSMRAKYACPKGHAGVETAPSPDEVIDGGNYDRSFLAEIVTGKFQDHLPLYRQVEIYRRDGIVIPLSTLCDQVTRIADLLAPIHRRILTEVLTRPWIQADESPVRTVIGKGKGKKTRKSYLWLYHSGPGLIYFDWTETREGRHPLRILGRYQGFLQTDDYVGYEPTYRLSGITEVGCMVHARRFFDKALGDYKQYASVVLGLIQALYAVEDEVPKEEEAAEERRRIRQEKAAPILETLHEWLETHENLVLPESTIGRAIRHMLNRWEALTIYTRDGRLHIDNNPAENLIRPVAVGRKNWLQFGSEEGGRRAAILLSLVVGCRSLGIDPHLYFWDVLHRIAKCPASQIHDLTPLGWKNRHMEEAKVEYEEWRSKMMASLAPSNQ